FVNLDMEEYHDLELTLQSFMRVLDEDEFAAIDAGIVLQAYLPDSHEALERLGQWARRRFERAGGHVKVRLVKGANLAMEEVEGELHGWLPAPYGSKADVDASFKAMLDSALRTEWSGALRVGVASHNLFDIAWALVVARQLDARDRVDIEMLEGMAPAQARAVYAAAGELLMYAPVVADEDFDASIAYLSRRLDENTQPDNFLRSLFTLRPNTPAFDREAERFRRSVAGRVNVSRRRHRRPLQPVAGSFANQPDSDMTDPEVRAAIGRAIGSPRRRPTPHADIPAIDATVAAAAVVADTPHSPEERALWLRDAADLMQRERAETIGLMARTVAKTAREGDPEVSEAIDFCRYYGTNGLGALAQAQEAGMRVEARGVVAVIAPWNFPYAIPTGGVAAALAAGNSVILKPAPEALELGAWIADQFWRAGVPRDVLHLVICDDGPVGTHLVTHPDIDTVVLTGSYDTAAMFLDWRPDLRVLAETSGKNALVVTASADLDLAIADLVRSAFGHAGQKCSAASLGIIEAAVYDDPAFQRRLREAVRSLRVLPATDPASMMGPVIAPPAAKLERALTTLESGEWWLVRPQPSSDDGRLWTPGVRVGVEPGSWFHLTECFGPVLGLMRARDLDHAIELQNAPEFGLTGGIHSLDVEEIERWLAGVQIGNAYVNRHITGAIVRRQPFGGWKHSSVGGGAKAGGPGYVPQFARISDPAPSVDAARASYEAAWRDRYAVEHDPSGLRCESNVLRYRPLARVAVRHDGDDETALAMLRAAAAVAGVEVVESDARTEPADRFVERLDGVDRVRLLGDLDDEARRVAHRANVPIDAEPPVGDGMVELQHWVREQAISRTRHRHGRLVD
ncbi:MAG: proline dehydrogenase family protein, partial [Ilumatobacter sp.]|uniref:proline dehydrogenase family protein n=1 Tax=Ilumatobacter sp. TaxID=1967498 RepID=UPI002634AD80